MSFWFGFEFFGFFLVFSLFVSFFVLKSSNLLASACFFYEISYSKGREPYKF